MTITQNVRVSADVNAGHSIRPERHVVQSVAEMQQLIADPDNAGRTFPVAKEVFDFFRHTEYLPAPKGEAERISKLLGFQLMDGTFGMTRTCVCEHCGHSFCFADHVDS